MTSFKKYAYTIIWIIIMSYLLFSPSSGLPKGGRINIPNFDKLVHFAMFAILCIIFLWDRYRNNEYGKIPLLLFIIFSLIFAGSSELIQHNYIEGREGNIFDFIADIVGVISGILFWIVISRLFLEKTLKNKKEA